MSSHKPASEMIPNDIPKSYMSSHKPASEMIPNDIPKKLHVIPASETPRRRTMTILNFTQKSTFNA